MANIKLLGDLITAIQGRSTAGVVYSVQASTVNPGTYDVLRNGVRTYSFLFPGSQNGNPAAWSGASTDANPAGFLVELISADGVSTKADPAQFVLSLN